MENIFQPKVLFPHKKCGQHPQKRTWNTVADSAPQIRHKNRVLNGTGPIYIVVGDERFATEFSGAGLDLVMVDTHHRSTSGTPASVSPNGLSWSSLRLLCSRQCTFRSLMYLIKGQNIAITWEVLPL